MNITDIQNRLNANGFPCGPADGVLGPATTEAVKHFQTAYLGPLGLLAIDGIPGPQTQQALEFLPHLSTNFVVSELACHHCGNCYVHRDLLGPLERLRDAIGGPLELLDAYRCEAHNQEVGGVGGSQHTLGRAADLKTQVPYAKARNINAFGGIGVRGIFASHVDVREGGNAYNPERWRY